MIIYAEINKFPGRPFQLPNPASPDQVCPGVVAAYPELSEVNQGQPERSQRCEMKVGKGLNTTCSGSYSSSDSVSGPAMGSVK
ncbi:hypothetical protein GCM10008955_22870 [Deinococcus malanensis]|uniref:Uncharacterized protein n=1 Tax=Deinococcus malanensis TaxID=1706855 RepID=A0ABQ2EZJ4_9DEIO|nr:hypothetical protein GCM10008955_22870 [Deinococcus malanensis]